MTGEELAMFGVDRDVKEHTFYIQAQHPVLGSDDRLDHVKVLVGCLTLDRCVVETAEDIDDALLGLVRRSECEPLIWRGTGRFPEQGLDTPRYVGP